MVDTSLATAIQKHIALRRHQLFEAKQTSSEETIILASRALEEAEKMPNNPELFFEAQRTMYY